MPKGLEVTVNMENLKPVKETIRVLADMLKDERVPADVRSQYRERCKAIKWATKEFEEGYVIGASTFENAVMVAQAHGLHHKRQWVYAYAGVPSRLRDGIRVASKDKLLGDFSPEERALLTAHLEEE
ncbi:hypothetical protein B2I21_07415 [Chryseobacterium mucoviscidosis]|nr:hypothetical protein B2I21_07415 [Chryseobacterium mucoviscidosis]